MSERRYQRTEIASRARAKKIATSVMVAAMGTTQHLGEGAVQRAELALQGSVLWLRGMQRVLMMRMPRGVRQCCLLREQQE